MPDFIRESQRISGVMIAELPRYPDPRGVFCETFRQAWFPQVDWSRLQSNCSKSKAHVLRGLHYHFEQVDYWYVSEGRIRAALVDLRPSSSTYMACQTIDMGEDNNLGLFIPIGVAHGFIAQTDCTLMYYVNNYYNGGSDEYGVAWDEPAFTLDWGLEDTITPELSERDANNRYLKAIPADELPE